MLEGLKVLDVTHFLAGPFCTLILADLGADVIKIEDPDHPDEARTMPPHFVGGESLYYLSLNWGKRSAAVRLGTTDGRRVFHRLAAKADLVIDNYRPGVMRKLGLDHEALSAVNPRLITCSITGFGEDGPYSDRPGYDYTVTALSGIQDLTSDPPARAGVSYADHGAGMAAALAMVSAVLERERTGSGRHLDVSLLDVQISFLTYIAAFALNAGDVTRPVPGGGHPVLVPSQNFATLDGHVAVFVGNDTMWKRACSALQVPALEDSRFDTVAGRLAHKTEVLGLVAGRLAKDTTARWVQRLEVSGVPCAPVNRVDQALEDAHVRARGLVAEDGIWHVVGPFPKLRGVSRPAPGLGEHTAEVLTEFGLS